MSGTLLAIAVLAALGPASWLLPRAWRHGFVYGGAGLIATGLAAWAALGLVTLPGANAVVGPVRLPVGLPWLHVAFGADALSLLFLLAVDGLAALASLFALGYAGHAAAPERVQPAYPVYLAAMNLVLLAEDAFGFLFAWELMSVVSWLLVLADHEREETRRAGLVYITMASFGTLALLLTFGLMAGGEGGYAFAAMRAAGPHGPLLASAVVLLALIGAGSKAGLVPLHVWLPLAHPAAPSHVSALMSGAMTKVAIYGLVRIVFDLAGPLPTGWGITIALVGAITAAMGVLYAVIERDLKTLLAYSTVENIGIVVTALGLAQMFRDQGVPVAAALALVAALFHVLNHALFKGLLFFGAGVVQMTTGERWMERLGGLMRRLPRTGFLFLVGACAIAALPPLNGFVSEWLTFQALLQGPVILHWPQRLGVPVVGAFLALSAALAAATFVKAFGIVFLGRPRSEAAARASGEPRSCVAAMGVAMALCFLFGVLPYTALALIVPVAESLLGPSARAVELSNSWVWLMPLGAGRGSYSGVVVVAALVAVSLVTAATARRIASHRLRRAPRWDCGFPDPDPATQYSASSFAQPIRRVYGTSILAAVETVEMPPPESPLPARFSLRLADPAWRFLFGPVTDALGFVTDRANVLQFLTIRRYLTLMFGALILLLIVAAVR